MEDPVRNAKGKYSFIDLFWPGIVLVEHKSLGQDLGRGQSQAFRYIDGIFGEQTEPGNEVVQRVIRKIAGSYAPESIAEQYVELTVGTLFYGSQHIVKSL